MAMTHSESQTALARLTVTSNGTRLGDHVVGNGASLMIGSGNNCGIRLDDPSISSIHCIVRSEGGELLVQDWCSTLGTYLGDTRVEEEMVVPSGACLRLGRYQIRVELTDKGTTSRPPSAGSGNGQTASNGVAVIRPPEQLEQSILAPVVEEAEDQKEEVEPEYLAEIDRDELDEDDNDLSVDDLSPQRPTVVHGSTSGDERRRAEALLLAGIDPETVQLLQAEIECLQCELSERDRQLIELRSQLERRAAPEPELDSTQTEALVARLEQLLQELKTSDHRTRVLEELLRTEQEVTRAQQEEQSQVESWLKDIERRVLIREQEWQAEREMLVHRAQQFKEERDDTDRRLEAVEQNPHGGALQQSVVRELRAQIDSLQEQLEAANRAHQSLQAELELVRAKSPEEARREFIEEALREDRLKLAQEQAALSRERAQLAKRLAELEQESQRGRRVEPDERFRAFRQTLKELHHEDQVGTPGLRRATLGTRIADLWRKLDGPTDTD